MSDLTKPQADLLRALRYTPGYAPASYLLTRLGQHHKTEQGVHMTAASLVRRGYLLKRKQHERARTRATQSRYFGPTGYAVTPKAVEWLQAEDSLKAQAAR